MNNILIKDQFQESIKNTSWESECNICSKEYRFILNQPIEEYLLLDALICPSCKAAHFNAPRPLHLTPFANVPQSLATAL